MNTALPVIMSLILGAHFLRGGQPGMVMVFLLLPLLLIPTKKWCAAIVALSLTAGSVVWVLTGIDIASQRIAEGESWGRAMIIMGSVALVTALAAFGAFKRLSLKRYAADTPGPGASVAAFIIVFVVCAFPQNIMRDPVPILLERFFTGGGWIEIFGLSLYAAWLVDKLLSVRETGPIRRIVWVFFSIVFFLQFILGVAGIRQCLMTGALHVPVPAVILAGPIFRGEGFFMPILFGSVLLFVGPAWCSWLCYIGGWDNLSSMAKPVPLRLDKYREWTRVAILATVVITAFALRIAGVPGLIAATIAGVFGVIGVGIMAVWSRKRGVMVHCTMYCPMGLLAILGGKINPFRMKIREGCTECQSCAKVCRYGALGIENIRRRKPGMTCTLCGDCTAVCSGSFIDFQLFGIKGLAARKVFLVLVVALHAVFLGFARI